MTTLGRVLVFAGLLMGASGQLSPVFGQAAVAGDAANAEEADRREIMESDRWRRATRGLNEWLSVQQLYSPDEVAVLRSQFRSRVAKMSPTELKNHLDDMEDKLAVLSSPEAEEARRWMSQFLAVQAKYTDAQLRAKRPDVANMTASQIRRELEQFQARRGVTQQSQAAVQQSRAVQVQATQDARAAQQRAAQAARQNTTRPSTAATIGNQNLPRQKDLPGHSVAPPAGRPFYTVGPWGHPIAWDPLAGFW